MKHILNIIVFAANTVFAQTGNLVQDPGFDDPAFIFPFNCMPFPPNDCSPWIRLYDTDPNVYSVNSSDPNKGIPSNSHNGFVGYQFQTPDLPFGIPNTRYVFLFMINMGLNKEGMSNHLASPLICGTTYKIEFDCSRHDELNEGTIQVVGRFGNSPGYWSLNGNTSDVFKANINSDETGGPDNEDWLPFYFLYTPDRCDLEYLLLQTETPLSGILNKGVYIDNVRVTPVFVNCSSTKNCIDISYQGNHDFNNPFKVSGLQNFSEAILRIYQTNDVLIRTIAIANPPNSICWDGKTDYGEEAAGGSYKFKLSGFNECVEEFETSVTPFYKTNNWGEPTTSDINQFPGLCYSSVTKPPEECCMTYLELENVSIVDDITIPGPVTYSISGDLKIKSNVTIPATVCGIVNSVEFNAVEEIDIELMDVETGAQVNYDINSCPMKPYGSSDIIHVLSNDGLKHFNDSLNMNLSSELFHGAPVGISNPSDLVEIEIIPNPVSDFFTLNTDFHEELNCICYNIWGKVFYSANFVKTTEINTSMWPRGTYFIIINDRSSHLMAQRKIILQ